jgi:hypothetical protein
LSPVCYNAVFQQPPPLGDYLAGALPDAVIGFPVLELEEAGEVALEATDSCGDI